MAENAQVDNFIMEFSVAVQRAMKVRSLYAQLEKQRYCKTWSAEQLVQGFVGDVGDLAKIIMAKEGYRAAENVDAKLAHELADCLWSVIVLANAYDVDLESAFTSTMDELEKQIIGAIGE